MMVEVFKTNIENQDQASKLIDQIHERFTGYEANFDLEDCDNILRVKCTGGIILSSLLIDLLKDAGFTAEVLKEDYPAFERGALNQGIFY